MTSIRVIVLAGGDPVTPQVRAQLPDDAVVIAADSGLHQAGPLGLHVDYVVGDLDSADPDAVERAEAAGAVIERYPAEKDATDLELALDRARAVGARQVTVVGGAGGRLDHFLGNVTLLASTRFADLEIDARLGDAYVAVAHGGREPHRVSGAPGSLLTLLPVGADAVGITTHGLQYALRDATLSPGTTRGVSNVLLADTGTVVLRQGTLLVIQPAGGSK